MPTTEFKSRRTGLIVFGILEIIIGLIYLVPMGALMLPAVTQAVPDAVMAIAILAALAIVSIWLGIGTLMGRRWARALSLLVAWDWLAVGLLMLVYSLFAPDMSTGMLGVFIFITLVAAMFVFFYGSKNVKATFEARDPHIRWTDKCPLPVLALSLAYGLTTLSALIGTYTNTPIPFFGTLLTGLASQVYYLLQLGLAAYLAWGTYKLTRNAWLISVGLTVLFGASAVVSYSTIDMTTLYRAMNVPYDQIELMRQQGWGTDRIAFIFGVLSILWLGYLVYVKKYFTGASLQQRAA